MGARLRGNGAGGAGVRRGELIVTDGTVLSGEGLLAMWCEGRDRPQTRAAAMLAAAYPERDPRELDLLPLGQRDGLLLDARRHLLGSTLTCLAACASCGETLEFSVDVAQVRAGPPPINVDFLTVGCGDTLVTARPLTGADLDAIAGTTSIAEARAALIQRVVLSVTRGGEDAPVATLTEVEIAALGEALEAHDPWTDVRTEMACPHCGGSMEAVLDVAAFVWDELAGHARSLLFEVDVLARRYGWSEAEVLAMTPARRRLYLDLA